MTMNNISAATSKINEIIAKGERLSVEISTEPKMNKRNNPYYGRVRKETAYIGINFDAYSKLVNERREFEGKDGDFQAKKSPYEKVNDFFLKKGEQYYIRLCFDKGCVVRSFYEVDGRTATEEEIAAIKTFFPTKTSNAAHQGLTDENEVQTRIIKIENVVAIGGDTFTEYHFAE